MEFSDICPPQWADFGQISFRKHKAMAATAAPAAPAAAAIADE